MSAARPYVGHGLVDCSRIAAVHEDRPAVLAQPTRKPPAKAAGRTGDEYRSVRHALTLAGGTRRRLRR